VAVDDELPADLFTSGTRPSMLRVAAGSIATAWFLLRNMAVSVPVEPEIYDLLVTMPDGIRTSEHLLGQLCHLLRRRRVEPPEVSACRRQVSDG
jgi:hypothetical protein